MKPLYIGYLRKQIYQGIHLEKQDEKSAFTYQGSLLQFIVIYCNKVYNFTFYTFLTKIVIKNGASKPERNLHKIHF